jgi:hypothetical protein
MASICRIISGVLVLTISFLRFTKVWQEPAGPIVIGVLALSAAVFIVLTEVFGWRKEKKRERDEEQKELRRQQNQAAWAAEIVAKTIASSAPASTTDRLLEIAPRSAPLEEPRIYLGIQDAADQVFPGAQFILSNQGKITAHNVLIQPFKLCRKSVIFRIVPFIHPTKEVEVQATVSDVGVMFQHNIFYWLNKDWDGGGKVTDDWPIEILIRYSDPSGRKFEAALTMVFHPITHMMNQKIKPDAPSFLRRQPQPSLEFTDIRHKSIN